MGDYAHKIDNISITIPNIPHSDVPVAPGAKGNKVVRTWGEPKKLGFKGKDHLELGANLGWLSMEQNREIFK